MELLEAKVCAILSLLLATLLVGLLPALFTAYGRNNNSLFLSSLLCFGGGVLFSTSVVHMLPEIRENLGSHKQYTELLFCAGFFLLYFVDELVHLFLKKPCENPGSFGRHQCAKENEPLLHGRQFPYNPSYVNEYHHPPQNNGNIFKRSSSFVSVLGLLVALCVHGILEGLAVGLERSPSQVLLLLGAIACHKLVVGFCLGTEVCLADNSLTKHLLSIVLFALGTPIGIGIGIFISNSKNAHLEGFLPILQCLAGGTLLYVSVAEVLPRERSRWQDSNFKKKAGLVQFTAVTFGFVVMTVLNIYMGKIKKSLKHLVIASFFFIFRTLN